MPTVDEGLSVSYAPARRAAAKLRWYAIVLLVSSPLIYFLVKIIFGWIVISAEGRVSLDPIDINSAASGIVDAVLVKPGDVVTQGAVIVKMSNPDNDQRETIIRSELEAERSLVDLYSSTTLPKRTDTATVDRTAIYGPLREALAVSKRSRDYQLKYYQTIQNLFNQGAATRAELNLAHEQYTRAQSDVVRAEADLVRARLDVVQPIAVPTSYREYLDTQGSLLTHQGRLANLMAELDAIGRTRGRLTLTAPTSGRVLDIMVTQGQPIVAGAPVALIGQPSKAMIVAFVEPKHIRYARKDAKARVQFSSGGKMFAAKVAAPPEYAQKVPEGYRDTTAFGAIPLRLVVKIETTDPIPEEYVVEGMPVKVRFGFSFLSLIGL